MACAAAVLTGSQLSQLVLVSVLNAHYGSVSKLFGLGTVDIRLHPTQRSWRQYTLRAFWLSVVVAIVSKVHKFRFHSGKTVYAHRIFQTYPLHLAAQRLAPILILLVRNGRALAMLSAAFALLTVGWSYGVLTTYPQLADHSLIDLKLAGRDSDIELFYKHLYISMPVRLSQFIFGMVGAWVVLNRTSMLSRIRGATKVMLVTLIVIGAALPLVRNPFTILAYSYRPIVYFELLFGRVTFAAAIATMIVMMHSGALPTLKKQLSAQIFETVARFSFSMYLFHPIFIYLGIVMFIGTDKTDTISVLQYVGVCTVGILGSMLFGLITWHVIESPAIRFSQKKFG